MKNWPRFPVVLEMNASAWLHGIGRGAGRAASFEDVPDAEIEKIASAGYDAVWLMGVWKRSKASIETALAHPGLASEFAKALPGFSPADVAGSPYAVADYTVEPSFGGDGALAVLRKKMAAAGVRLILDFVPNHVARDHGWCSARTSLFVKATGGAEARSPQNYFGCGGAVFAHGKDPNFDGWTDTAQLDYRSPETRKAMKDALLSVSRMCDAVRCDMAMLPVKSVFLRTWGGSFTPPAAEFWPAAITDVKASSPDFLMVAESYWDMEWELQQHGFDYCYDKRLYDRLVEGEASSVKLHLCAERDYQSKLVRFVENHDERRAAEAFGAERSRSAAALVLTLPGMRLVHSGQENGFRVKVPVQLRHGPDETPDPAHRRFYAALLDALKHPVFHDGDWRLLEPEREWEGNRSYANVVAHRWLLDEERRLVVVNASGQASQCFIRLDFLEPWSGHWLLTDLTGSNRFLRSAEDMAGKGLYLDIQGNGFHVFRIERAI